MKKLLLIPVVYTATLTIHAQKIDSSKTLTKVPVTVMNNSRVYNGFTIQLTSKNITSYSFDILAEKTTRHFQNPMPFAPKGIQKKEDAYKIAQWIINEYKKTGHWENLIPPHVARQLGVDWSL
jgi:hypothetical protein